MIRLLTTAVSVLAALAVIAVERVEAQAPQEEPAASQAPAEPVRQAGMAEKIPVQVQVVLSRYQGDKRISSMPYALAVNAMHWPSVSSPPYGEPSRLRMGAEIPVPSLQPTSADSQVVAPVSPVTYQEIGTNIDARARTVGEGIFELSLSLQDKSVYASDDPASQSAGRAPVFRTFQSENALLLRDGQSQQFTAATDRVNGEVVRVEVTLTVVK